jgi:hypothetical protein
MLPQKQLKRRQKPQLRKPLLKRLRQKPQTLQQYTIPRSKPPRLLQPLLPTQPTAKLQMLQRPPQ